MTLKPTPSFLLFPLMLWFTLWTPRSVTDHFNWQTLESGMLKVHWYQGNESFGQAAMEAAEAGLESIGNSLPSAIDQPIDIFLYATVDDLQSEQIPGSQSWAAGHADPALGAVRVVVEPGPDQGITMEQRIPHELMHVLLYRYVGPGYQNLPAWLREGMATQAELYPNAEYDRVLADAVAANSLIPLKDICGAFPEDTGQAFLAYAQARSFTGYLRDIYGATGLRNLATSYADGLDCEYGPEHAFGLSLSSLESEWRASVLGQNTAFAALQNSSPYLVLLCLVLLIPLIGVLSTLRRKGSGHEPGINLKR